MARKPETALVDKIRKELGRRGIYTIKIHGDPYQPKGEADLICCVEGRFVALEVKVDGNEPSTLQEYTMKLIRQSGGTAAAVWSVEEAIEAVKCN